MFWATKEKTANRFVIFTSPSLMGGVFEKNPQSKNRCDTLRHQSQQNQRVPSKCTTKTHK